MEDLDRYMAKWQKEPLIAMDNKTWKPIAIGDLVTSFRGEKATFMGCDRVNELRYGGRRSGKVVVQWPGDIHKREYYDNVFDITVIDLECENPVPEGLVS